MDRCTLYTALCFNVSLFGRGMFDKSWPIKLLQQDNSGFCTISALNNEVISVVILQLNVNKMGHITGSEQIQDMDTSGGVVAVCCVQWRWRWSPVATVPGLGSGPGLRPPASLLTCGRGRQ